MGPHRVRAGAITNDDYRLRQIASLAQAEPFGSAFYYTHVGLLTFAALSAAAMFGTWGLLILTALYITVLTVEKLAAARAHDADRADDYVLVLALLLLRALCYNVLVLVVWSLDGDIFKLAAVALIVAATINIFVFHATYPVIIACVVAPVWLCLAAMGVLIFAENGLSLPSLAAAMVALCI